MTNLKEACIALLDAVEDTGIEANFCSDGVVNLYWNGVNRLDCNANDAAKAIKLIQQLAKLGMKDC